MDTKPFDFTGARAVVVGGASGLGRAMADGLARHGASVVIVARTVEKAQKAAETIEGASGSPCHACAADLASEESVRALGASLDHRFTNGVNIAVNCAGINIRNPIERIALAEWESIQRVNSTGAFLFAREMYPRLKRSGWGRLIHVASIFGSRSFRHRTSYASSKGALLQLTRTLAIEWADDRITVNAISPGPIFTEMTRPILDNQDAYREFCRHIPLGRFGEPAEVVTACLFLASPASSYVTGADIAVDGGWMAR
jgi:NAD(P)-dependent dehydrogenase (short-subunit alcohol dehydrogenase family)